MTAYFLTPHYNGIRMLDGNPQLMRCATCNSPTNLRETPLLLDKKPSGSPQISITIDEYYIASPAFIRRYEEEGFCGLEFEPLPNGYYHVTPTRWIGTYEEFFPEWHRTLMNDFPESGPTLVYPEPPCSDCGAPGFVRMDGLPMPGKEVPPISPNEIVGTQKRYGDNRFYMMAGEAWRAASLRKKITGTSFYAEVEWSDKASNSFEQAIQAKSV